MLERNLLVRKMFFTKKKYRQLFLKKESNGCGEIKFDRAVKIRMWNEKIFSKADKTDKKVTFYFFFMRISASSALVF